MSQKRWQNWSRMASCLPQDTVRPLDTEDVVKAITAAGSRGTRLRMAGTGHSFNRLACTSETLLDMRALAGVVRVNAGEGTVTVRPGTTIAALARHLDEHGLALPNVGTLAEQTIGGAVATGNHGSGLAFGALASSVVALTLATANGSTRHLSASDGDLMRSARVSLGALGVVTELTLKCVPAFNLRSRVSQLPLDEWLGSVPLWASSADHVAMSWVPWRDDVTIRRLHRTDAPITPGARRQRWVMTADEVKAGLVGWAGARRAALVPWASTQLPPCGTQADYVDVSHRVFTFAQPTKFIALEHAVDLTSAPAAVADLARALRQLPVQSPYSLLVRVAAADDPPLSPGYGRRTAHINLTVPRGARYAGLLRTVEQVLRGHDARPHWGKAHNADWRVLSKLYPEWETFRAVREAVDPDGIFLSNYLEDLLGARSDVGGRRPVCAPDAS